MQVIYNDPNYNFYEIFNPKTGFLFRSSIFNSNNKDPFMRSYPETIDIGIMGHCQNSYTKCCLNTGIGCYQRGFLANKPNMSLDNFRKIIRQSKQKTFQIALGGAGDPNKHEEFERILDFTVKNGIVPNYTTSGVNLTKREVEVTKNYCGAVAVSYYSRLIKNNGQYHETNELPRLAIDKFLSVGCKVNIHFVLTKDTISDALLRLKNRLFPENINAVVFLLYKPIGLGKISDILTLDNPVVEEFYTYVEENNFPFKIGFDTCNVPALLKFCSNITPLSLDACEAGRFSMYISSDMYAMPCSFDCNEMKWAVNLNENNIQEAWESEIFNNFRKIFETSCPKCNIRIYCFGGCPISKEIVLCNNKFDNGL